jgi:hypothetical protein
MTPPRCQTLSIWQKGGIIAGPITGISLSYPQLSFLDNPETAIKWFTIKDGDEVI